MDELKGLCLSGYWYDIDSGPPKEGHRKVMVHTGAGGAKMYIDVCRKEGIPDEFISESIFCWTDMGRLPLSILKVTKIENNG